MQANSQYETFQREIDKIALPSPNDAYPLCMSQNSFDINDLLTAYAVLM